MSVLAFKVNADWQEVQRLREEIQKLKSELKGLNVNSSPDVVKQLENQLSSCVKKYEGLIAAASKAGTEMTRSMKEMQRDIKDTASNIEHFGTSIENIFSNIAKTAGIAFSLNEAKQFVSKVAETRAYFQDIESSMKVFLGSEKAAQKFTNELKGYAFYNMFEFSDLANASKQMIAYGHSVESIIPRLDQLSNIARGTGANLMEVVQSYNVAKNLGVIDTRHLQSWAAKGLVVKDILKEMGETVGKTGVTFEQFNKVLDKVTGEGGMFHDLMLEQMENISAEQGQLADNLDAMYNEIGENMEGVITGVIKAESFLVDHWKEVGEILAGLVASYGVYRAALIATRAVEKAQNKQRDNLMNKALDEEIDKYQKLLGKKKDMVNADLAEAVAKGKLSQEQANEIAGKRELLKLLAAEAGAKRAKELEPVKEAYDRLQAQKDIVKEKELENLQSQTNYDLAKAATQEIRDKIDVQNQYISQISQEASMSQEGQDTLNQALQDRKKLYEELHQAVDTELDAQKDTIQTAKELNEAIMEADTAETELNSVAKATNTTEEEMNAIATNQDTAAISANSVQTTINTVETNVASKAKALFSIAIGKVGAAFSKLWAVLKANPLGAVMSVVTLAIPLLDVFGKKTDEMTEATEKFMDAVSEETNHVAALYAVLENSTTGTKVHKKAQEELKRVAQEYGITIKKEIDLTKQLKAAKDKLIDSIKEEAIERTRANMLKEVYDQYETDMKKQTKEFVNDVQGMIGEGAAKSLSTFIANTFQQTINEAGKAKAKVERLSKEVKLAERTARNTDVSGKEFEKEYERYRNLAAQLAKAEAEYEKLQASADETTKKILKDIGKGEGDLNKYNDVQDKVIKKVRELIGNLGGVSNSFNASTDATNNAANAIERQEIASKGATAQLGSLVSVSEQLINQWNAANPHMTFSIDVDATKLASWVNKLPEDRLKQSINARIKALGMIAEGKRVKVGGKEKTEGQITKELAALTYRGQQIEADKIKTTSTSTDKKKKTKKDDKEKRLADTKREQWEYEERLEEIKRQAEDAATDAIIAEIENDGERERRTRAEEHKRNLRQIEDEAMEMRKEVYEHRKKIYENKHKGKYYELSEEGGKGWKNITLTDDEKSIISNKNKKESAEYNRTLTERYKAEQRAYRQLLSEYGSYEQKRLAITQEYEEKIKEAQSPAEVAYLRLQQSDELEKLSSEQLTENIDWAGVFSSLQNYTKDYLVTLQKQLQGVLNSGDLPVDQMAVIQEKLREINEEISKQSGLFDFVGERQREHNRLIEESNDAQRRLNAARQEETSANIGVLGAKQDISTFLSNQGITAKVSSDMGNPFQEGTKEYKKMEKLLASLYTYEGKLATARQKTAKATKEAESAEERAKRDSADAVADWFADAQEFITEQGIDQLPELFNSIGLGDVGDKIGKGLSGFNDAAGAAADFKSGNYIGALTKGISAIKNFGSMLGIGGGNAEKVNKLTEELTESNDRLRKSVDKLKESMDSNSGANAIKDYQDAYAAQERIQRQQLDILKAQNRYTAAHRSNAYYWRDFEGSAKGKTAFKQISDLLDKKVSSLNDLENLSPEEMDKIRTYLTDTWRLITSEVGKYDKSEFWENYADEAGKLEELTVKINENLTQISFDSLKDNFISSLMDMEKSAADFTKDFNKYFMKSLLNASVGNEMKEKLEKWYGTWAETMKSQGGSLTKIQIDAYRKEYDALVQEGMKMRDNLARLTGYDSDKNSSQSATANAIQGVTEDKAEELVGRITAIQIAGEQRNDLLRNFDDNFSLLRVNNDRITKATTEVRDITSECLNILAEQLLVQKDIRDNTDAIVKPIKRMSEDLLEMKEDLKTLK